MFQFSCNPFTRLIDKRSRFRQQTMFCCWLITLPNHKWYARLMHYQKVHELTYSMLFTIYSLFELQINKTPFKLARYPNQVTAGHLPLSENE